MEDVEKLAASVGVDLETEPQLVQLLKQLLVLPPNWSYDAENQEYVDLVSGARTLNHPARPFFNEMVERARTTSSAAAAAPTLPTIRAPGQDENSQVVLPETPWLAGAEAPPPHLTFNAWFKEGSHGGRGSLIRRDLTLRYNTETGGFKICVQGSDSDFSVPHLCGYKTGHPVDCYDLHTGAVLDCLGKPTTLMQAGNLATSSWVQGEAEHLTSLTRSISSELRKYGLTPPGTSVAATPVAFRSGGDPCEPNIRKLMTALESLYLSLVDVRPKAASAWARAAEKQGRKKIAQSQERSAAEKQRRLARGSHARFGVASSSLLGSR
jgi:hypothetical protein